MERIKISEETNFIGCWKLNDHKLCEDIINLFENNKQFHQKGITGIGIDENVKKSIDMPIDPKNLNNEEFKALKIYMNKLFECYQDYKTLWPFLNKIYGFWYGIIVFIGVEIPLAIVAGLFIYNPGITSAIQAAKILKFSSLMGLIAIYLGF